MKFDWNAKQNKQLVSALLSVKNADEAKLFLRDLMTEGEIEEFGKRLEAARLLSCDTQYTTIIENTGLSSTTVARIQKWLKGSLGGYRLVLSRISSKHHHTHSQTPVGKGLSLHTR
ncbi:MAG: TrpR YerC/YecD [Candidatus Pacebacteria bacterium]|nr:TrpR YerC/YecD [Candidatus Paceibacterota bacterium]